MSVQQITPTKPAKDKPVTTAPSGGGFAPQISTHPVAELTLGSNKENDADKEWYFE
ncbi:hypothetical protein [Streptomyces sp. enrichment culture]|uniref:hypothetical protein n=1 Tax=Streptomyces sp. enrichment culture TaxID=1795815 RepID=UPI003F577C3C